MTTANRFWAKVKRGAPGECWEWTGFRIEDGYGRTHIRGRNVLAHRFAWELANGPIPDGMCVLHRCDNPPCCNGAHHFLGTREDNNKDRAAKGRGGAPAGDAHWTRTTPAARLRGEEHGRRVLTADLVRRARGLHAEGLSYGKIAAAVGFNRSTIINAIQRRTWGHVP